MIVLTYELTSVQWWLMNYKFWDYRIDISEKIYCESTGRLVLCKKNWKFPPVYAWFMHHKNCSIFEMHLMVIYRYVRHLDMSVHTINLKTKICQLVDVIIKRRDDLSFRHEMKFRNKMVEYLSDWIMGVSHQVSPSGPSEVSPISWLVLS